MTYSAGDRRYAVVWCSVLPVVDDEADFDRATYVIEHFPTFDQAILRARSLIDPARYRTGFDQFGSVRLTEERAAPHWDFPRELVWDDVADLYVDDLGATYSIRDLRTIDNGED